MEVDKRHREIITKYLVGVDEAGRGALAGPVAVGLVGWPARNTSRNVAGGAIKNFLKDYPTGKDSKKLTPKQRDFWFDRIKELEKMGLLKTQVALVSNKVIDQRGINWAIKKGIEKCLREVGQCEVRLRAHLKSDFSLASTQTLVLLDGGLKAPAEWVNQQTIIKGDEKELVISLASIVAKVTRDREMVKLSKRYSKHHLHKHKGYGTRLHYQKIAEFGLLVIHRETYLSGYCQIKKKE